MRDLRVAIYSYFPPRAQHFAGGAQLVVRDLTRGLADRVRRVDVVCPVADEDDQLDAHPNLHVHPALVEPVRRTLTPSEREQNLCHVARVAAEADVIVSIDRGFPLLTRQPILLLLNNFSYGTEVDSVFGFNWDAITVPSRYLQSAITSVLPSDKWRNGNPSIGIASPGVDRAHFRPTSPDPALAWLGVRARTFVTFPHRPDPGKGIDAALQVLRLLRDSGEDIALLVPEAPKSVRAVRQRERAYVASLRQRVHDQGLEDSVVFHPWVPYELLPSYYSLARCCLVPSRLPESFGLTVLQAVSCGTPVVAFASGALPELLPPGHGVEVVPLNDVSGMASATAALIRKPDSSTSLGEAMVERCYSVDLFVDGVLEQLLATKKSKALYWPN